MCPFYNTWLIRVNEGWTMVMERVLVEEARAKALLCLIAPRE